MGLLDWIIGRRVQVLQLGADDIVVFVVGPSGSGKSVFVEQVTKSDLIKVGESLRPSTAKVQAIRCELTEEAKNALGVTVQKNVVFVDTPSFNTGTDDDIAEKEMNNWLSKSRSKSALLGIIYVHRVETDPNLEPVQRHLDTFTRTFPQDFVSIPRRLRAVLSYEGVISEDTVQQRRATFQAQLDALRAGPGKPRLVTSFHPKLFQRGDSETAWRAVIELFLSEQRN